MLITSCFADEVGSAAAPTASLHFTPELLYHLEKKGICIQTLCLHVGLGTFKPVAEEQIENQKLHYEPMKVEHQLRTRIAEAKQQGKSFLPVGTTMIRYLESLPYLWRLLKEKNQIPSLDSATLKRWDQLTEKIDLKLAYEFIAEDIEVQEEYYLISTRLFIKPGIPFLLTDELITNFHLPKSSLMMVIAAFIGRKNLLNCYQEAMEKGYRFYSF